MAGANLFAEIGEEAQRLEILEWYHLKENFYKLAADSELLELLETQLWGGEIESTIALVHSLKPSGGEKFLKPLQKHRLRLINYHQV